MTCHMQTCLKDEYSKRQDHTKLVHCSECCSSSYCNGKLCNLPNDHRLNFTTCYSCAGIRDPSKCHTIVDCPPNEICSIEAEAVVNSELYLRYDIGCKPRTVIDLFLYLLLLGCFVFVWIMKV
ncbi:Hypothetical predicted protein [Mytilus galloprovincialis]|uniref:Uncharacterized protein n=1 Tax=Mytilus galloprovincialis TaxID=29158 RepID=A0A8B6DS19_MYTGA|nr:Hypothetical predicted protein [Mytilus galloprovincialis]